MNAAERSLILPITIGSMLEWYEVFLYIYWTPIIASSVFDLSFPAIELIHALAVFVVGFVSRPLGGLLFGFIGDRWGRKRSFLLTIFLISLPSFATALMPSFTSWTLLAVIFLGAMKFIQGVPAGGELPGAVCFLAEGAGVGRKRYLCSFALVGPQIGQILSMTQCLILQNYLSHKDLIEWGWRLSFFIGGVIGILGFLLRTRLHESESFHHLKKKHEVLKNPIKETFKNHKKDLFLGFSISIFEVVGFFMIAFYILQNSGQVLELDSNQSLLFYIAILVPLVIVMPIIGKIGDKIANKPMYIFSAVGIIILSLPFYFSILNGLKVLTAILLVLFVLLFSIQFALLPSLIADLYPTHVRFTCIGFSFNICDSIVGGVIPLFGIMMLQLTGNPASFVIIFPITALIFLFTLKHVAIKA